MQHLAELRNRLMVASAAVLIATVVGFYFAKDIILALEVPAHLGKPLQIISPTEGFPTYMRVAIITPTPDPFNQTLVSVPMYLLFELGLLLSRFGGGRRRAT